ncbi:MULTISPECIES: fimbrial biogenesis chaperone [Deinococcus]|uniref:fimbrial biogenesis chaperone n=1 Tax=Deinococcus TaxID=1298 RepID=UPI00048128D9|nr:MULTISPECIES: fimbria/pilus periplasmic chaperone [Deinococcus]KEF34330.1 hypothetical protein RDMS_07960 [Deinococcus sp. RL]
MRRLGKRAVALATALTLLGWALAQPLNFSIAPTSFQIESSKTLSGQTRLTNVSTQPAVFTVSALSWVRVGGEDRLEPTRDVLVSPSRFVLQPGSSQVIRVAVQRRPGADELTYRVLVRQVQPEKGELPPGQEVSARLDSLIELSLPVYVVPPGAAPRIGYRVLRSADGKDLSLVFSNAGNRSFVLRGLEVSAGSDPTRKATGVPPSFLIFRGNEYRVPLSGFGTERRLTFSFQTPEGRTVRETVDVP